MFISVKYYSPKYDGYAGVAYTYETKLPLQEGDIVCAPTKNEPKSKAMVVAVDIPAPKFQCKEITELYPKEG